MAVWQLLKCPAARTVESLTKKMVKEISWGNDISKLKDLWRSLGSKHTTSRLPYFFGTLAKSRKRIALPNHRSLVATSINNHDFRSDLSPVRLSGQYLSQYNGRRNLPIDSIKAALSILSQGGGFLWHWRIPHWVKSGL